jgi:hypothetical protein
MAREETLFTILADTLRAFGIGNQQFFNELRVAIAEEKLDASSNLDDIGIVLRNSEYLKQRFSANTIRRNAGLQELPLSEILSLENSYSAVLRQNNMPAGFYDDPATDFQTFIANTTSPQEIQRRVQQGYQAVRQQDPEVLRQFQELYGIGENDLAAFFLDPTKMEGEITKKAQAAELAAQARSAANIQLTGAEAEQIIGRGITATDQTRQALGALGAATGITSLNISEMVAGEEAISGSEAVAGILGANAAAQQRIQTRTRRRQAEFEAGGSFAGTQAGTTGLGTAQQ